MSCHLCAGYAVPLTCSLAGHANAIFAHITLTLCFVLKNAYSMHTQSHIMTYMHLSLNHTNVAYITTTMCSVRSQKIYWNADLNHNHSLLPHHQHGPQSSQELSLVSQKCLCYAFSRKIIWHMPTLTTHALLSHNHTTDLSHNVM